MPDQFDFRRVARRVLDIEKQAIDNLYATLDEAFDDACQRLSACQGKRNNFV